MEGFDVKSLQEIFDEDNAPLIGRRAVEGRNIAVNHRTEEALQFYSPPSRTEFIIAEALFETMIGKSFPPIFDFSRGLNALALIADALHLVGNACGNMAALTFRCFGVLPQQDQ